MAIIRNLVLFLLSLAIFCFISSSLAAEGPIVSVKTIYYPIVGTTATGLREEMGKLGPLDPATGKRFAAYTAWRVNWYYHYATNNALCRVTDITVNTDVTITLPRWQPPKNADRVLIRDWNRFLKALQTHENGHKKHGLKAGEEIYRMMALEPPNKDCGELKNRLDREGNQIIRKYADEDIRYDRVTGHGKTQGAVFP